MKVSVSRNCRIGFKDWSDFIRSVFSRSIWKDPISGVNWQQERVRLRSFMRFTVLRVSKAKLGYKSRQAEWVGSAGSRCRGACDRPVRLCRVRASSHSTARKNLNALSQPTFQISMGWLWLFFHTYGCFKSMSLHYLYLCIKVLWFLHRVLWRR